VKVFSLFLLQKIYLQQIIPWFIVRFCNILKKIFQKNLYINRGRKIKKRGFDVSNSDLSDLTDPVESLSSEVKSLTDRIKDVVDENTGLRNYIKDGAMKMVDEMAKLREEVSKLRRKKTPKIEKFKKWTNRVFKIDIKK